MSPAPQDTAIPAPGAVPAKQSRAARRRQPWSGPARRGGTGRAPRGFTLLEVLLVIALIAVAGSLFLVSLESLGKSSPADEFAGAFWRAMAQARESALASRRTVALRWDGETNAFLLEGGGGARTVPVPADAIGPDRECAAVFSEELPTNDYILVRGELVTRRPIPAVRIFPDGSCQAFAVELVLGAAKQRMIIDPWTGAEMLPTDTPKRGGRS